MERKHRFKASKEKLLSRLKTITSKTQAEPDDALTHSEGTHPDDSLNNDDGSNGTNLGSMISGVGESLQALVNTSIKDLWNVAYENLRQENRALIGEYEAVLKESITVICGPPLQVFDLKINVKDQIGVILQRKIEEADKKSKKISVGNSDISIRDALNTTARFVGSANEFITKAVGGNPQASIAWAGVSILLPLLINPSMQSNSLAKGLERISDLIDQSQMREQHYEEHYGPETESHDQFALPRLYYKKALEKLYRQILKFQAVSCCYYSKQSAVRLGLDVIKRNDWDQLANEVNSREDAFREFEKTWLEIQYEKARKAALNKQRIALSGIDSHLTASQKAFEAAGSKKEYLELLSWLCKVDPSSIYNTARNRHEEGTCEWLVADSEDFRTWETSPSSLMWLHGKAGSGKSILSSSVIKSLKDRCDSQPSQVLAYFFLSFSDAEKQKVDQMLASLIKQIWACLSDTPQFFEQFSRYKMKGEYPDIQTLEAALLASGASFSSVYIVIDGLDECPVYDGERTKLLKSLCRILAGAPENFHIVLTSRKEWDIDLKLRHLFSSSSRIEIDLLTKRHAINQDISHYINSTLETEDYNSWSEDLKERASRLLLEKADCMFQYIRCQFDALHKLSSMLEIEKALENLPIGLDATYDRILEAIDSSVRDQVTHLLKWLAFSNKALRFEQLSEAFAIPPDSDSPFDETKRLLSPKDILKYLSGLVIVEGFYTSMPTTAEYEPTEQDMSTPQTKPRVRLVHFSLKEYLISDRIRHSSLASAFSFSEEDAHLSIASSCLKYQMHLAIQQFTYANVNELYPLAKYSLERWMFHLEKLPMQSWPLEVTQYARLVLSPNSQTLHRQIYFVPSFFSRRTLISNPYCYTASLGCFQLTKMMMSREYGAIKYAIQEDLDKALLCAAEGGNMDVMHFLIEKGAKINVEDETWILILNHATHYRRLNLSKFLLQHRADLKGFRCNETKLLIESMRLSDSDCLEFLLGSGADINMQDERGTILHSAVINRNLERVRLLLAKGVNANAISKRYGTPLQALFYSIIYSRDSSILLETIELEKYMASAKDGKLRMIFELLIENGADINLQGGYYNMALHAICTRIGQYSNFGIVSEKIQFLINQGADVNASVDSYGTAMHVACASYHYLHKARSGYNFDQIKNCLRLLIQHGADINSLEKGCGTPLQLICRARGGDDETELVRCLIEMGADVNIQSDENGTALHAAVEQPFSKSGTLELLLENGAEIDLPGNERQGTALQSACYERNKEAVKLLLKYGADVNASDGRHGTPLIAACRPCLFYDEGIDPFGFQIEIVRTLLEHGADVNAATQDKDKPTPLLAACAAGNVEVVRLLLQNGADVNLCKDFAFHAAVRPEFSDNTGDLLRLLLDYGCDINHIHKEYGTALTYLLYNERVSIITPGRNEQMIRFLLDNGADVNLIGGTFGFALQAACTGWSASIGYEDTIDINMISNYAKFLLENCPDINVNAKGGRFGSALQAASYSGQTQSVRMLLEKNASVNARGGMYRSAFNAAIIRGHWNIVEILLEAGAVPDYHLQQCLDEDWLQHVKESEDEYEEKRRIRLKLELKRTSRGSQAIKRYRKFWEVETREREERVKGEELQMS